MTEYKIVQKFVCGDKTGEYPEFRVVHSKGWEDGKMVTLGILTDGRIARCRQSESGSFNKPLPEWKFYEILIPMVN